MQSTKNSVSAPESVSLTRICLEVRCLGHVPAKKNKFFKVVKKDTKEWQRNATALLLSQLRNTYLTIAPGISTTEKLQSLIASLPADDNWKVISRKVGEGRATDIGREGFEIVIEPLNQTP